jgi:hypothetical protein
VKPTNHTTTKSLAQNLHALLGKKENNSDIHLATQAFVTIMQLPSICLARPFDEIFIGQLYPGTTDNPNLVVVTHFFAAIDKFTKWNASKR